MGSERATAQTKRSSFAELKAMNPCNLATIEEERETQCRIGRKPTQISNGAEKFGCDHEHHMIFIKGFPYNVGNVKEDEKEEDNSEEKEESLSDEYIEQVLKEYEEDEYQDPAYYYYACNSDDDYSSSEENEEKENYATAEDEEEDSDTDIDNCHHKICKSKGNSCEDSSKQYDSEDCFDVDSSFEDSDDE